MHWMRASRHSILSYHFVLYRAIIGNLYLELASSIKGYSFLPELQKSLAWIMQAHFWWCFVIIFKVWLWILKWGNADFEY